MLGSQIAYEQDRRRNANSSPRGGPQPTVDCGPFRAAISRDSLFDVAKRAVDICDPDDRDGNLGDLLAQFEDADEPITGIENLEERLAIALEGVDIEIDDPAVSMAAATILYLAHRRDELHGEPETVMRLAARAAWKGDPPESVVDWLADRGVQV